MSEDLIRRSDAIKALDANFTIKGKENMQTVLNYLELVRTRIESAPTIEPKRGEWVNQHKWSNGFFERECSVCGAMKPLLRHTAKINFCPNCGADMRGDDNEAD